MRILVRGRRRRRAGCWAAACFRPAWNGRWPRGSLSPGAAR